MKILRRFRSGLYIIGLIAVLLLASCPNPLLTGIEEAVEVVVTPPEVKAVYPAANSSNIPTNLEVITVTFSKPIRSASVTTGTFLVKDTDGAAVSGTFEITNDTIKFKPNSGVLKYETTYTITATGKILDIDGNPLPAAFSWTFTTGLSPDEEAPYDIIVSIDNDAQWATSDDVAVQIQAKDNRGIAQINITDLGQTSFSAEGWTTFEAVYDEESSIYTSTVDWSFSGADGERTLWVKLKDGAGNTTVTAASDSISVDTQKPEINFVRLNGGISSTMSDTYTLDVSAKDEGSGVVQFRYRTGDGATAGAWSAWFDLTDGESNGNLVTFSVGQDETEWVDVQAIDVAGNISDIATEAISYDLTRPVISDKNFTHFSLANPVYYPFNGTVITIQFNEDMRESSVTDSTFEILEITLNTLKKYEYYVVDVKDLVTQVDGETVTLPNRVAEISGFELEPNNSYTINLSSTVTDLAGNELGSDYSWTISTGDSTDSDPPTGSIGLDATSPGLVAVLPTGASATNDPSIVLAIDATDRYNTVVGMKIWGDSGDPGTYPAFEQDAVWEPVTATKLWSLSSASFGTRYILYKFIDAAGNASPAPLPLKIIYDAAPPEFAPVDGFLLNDGSDYTNNSNGSVDILLDVTADYVGVSEMRISNQPDFSDGTGWITFAPSYLHWALLDPELDDAKTVYVQVRDYLGQYVEANATLVIDRLPPVIDVRQSLVATRANYAVYEGPDAENDIIEIADDSPESLVFSDIELVTWRKDSGPGNLTFIYGETDTQQREPTITASLDGEYIISITAADKAGNQTVEPLNFIWDTVDPENTLTLSAETPVNITLPTWTWNAVTGADFYRCSFNEDLSDPYYDVTATSFTATESRSEGENTLYVQAMDIAGNYAEARSRTVVVDLTPPAVNNDGQSFLAKETLTIDMTGEPGSTGAVNESVESYLWEVVDGPGAVEITGADTAIAGFTPADADGAYNIKLSLTDAAGNVGEAYYTLNWDTTAPQPPVINGPQVTMSMKPEWTWSGDPVDGSGYFNYRLVDTGTGVPVTNWLEGEEGAQVLTYVQPTDLNLSGDGIEGIEEFTLFVRERDAAGNWSDDATWVTVVNTIDVPAPFVTGPDLISDSTPTWNWTSGTLGSGIPETDTTYDVQINDTAEMGWIPLGTTTLTYTAPSSLSDGEYTLFVRETYLTNEPKIGSKTTMVDTTGPAKPIGMGPYALLPAGLETAENDRWATPDSTPGWRWQSGGSPDAIGAYGYRLMAGATELTSGTTTATTFLYTTALAEGVYTFYVKEFDQAGNPSPESSYRITVDWTPPVFNSVVAEGGAVYTNQTTINAALDFATETTPLTMCYYDYTVSKWTEWEPASTPKSIPAVAGNGERYAYFGLRDEAGNETYRWDLIILDQTAPTVSFVINNGDAYTPSTRCYLNITANDSYPNQSVLQVRQRYEGYEGPWQAYATSILSSFSFTNDAGSKTVYLDVRDAAGNVTTVSDTITLQLANPNYSWKGYNSIGSVRTYFNEVADPTGSYVTRYYVYYTADPNADPNGGSPMNGLGYVTNTYYYDGSVPTGQTYWFYVRVYNADTGGWGPFSSVGTLGYSSDIAIVYDDEDLDEATYLKNILTDYYSLETALYVEGKMPRWTVTLLHENYISNTYSSSNRIYGAPVILMPGISTFILDEKAGVIYQNTGRIRNIVTNGQGIVSLGPGGAAALDIIADNASSWGISDPPTYIGLDESRTDTTDSTTLTTIWPATPDNVWQFPLYYTKLAAPGAPAIFWKYPADGAHGALYFYKGIPPSGVDLKIFAAALEPRDFYPIVRQGRFLYYGYFKLPIYPVGMVFTVNMVYRMSLW